MPNPLAFNEGKACDVVLQRIEEREKTNRQDLCLHDRDGANAAVELTCLIAGRLFALEHSGIEPFEGHIKLSATAERYFQPIQDQVADALPHDDRFTLTIPVGALHKRKRPEITLIQKSLIAWIKDSARSLEAARAGRRAKAEKAGPEQGLPFPVSLYRSEAGGSRAGLTIVHTVPDDLQQGRVARVRRAYEKKCPKMEVWRRDRGARTVLILEENDIQVTNHELVHEAIHEVEAGFLGRPDEVWLVSTGIETLWDVWWLRIDEQYCQDLSYWGDSLSEVDPRGLINLTGRKLS